MNAPTPPRPTSTHAYTIRATRSFISDKRFSEKARRGAEMYLKILVTKYRFDDREAVRVGE